MSNLYPRDSEAPATGIDDMTRMSYLNEPGLLHNLAIRYAINEIYVRSKIFFLMIYLVKEKDSLHSS